MTTLCKVYRPILTRAASDLRPPKNLKSETWKEPDMREDAKRQQGALLTFNDY